MDKLIKYLREKLKLSDELIKVVLENIKIKYVVPTYYFEDQSFTDLNVLDDDGKATGNPFYNLLDFNEVEMNSLITSIINVKGKSFIPKMGLFSHLKVGEEYWAIYKNARPINVVVEAIQEKTCEREYYTYNRIRFLNKDNNHLFSIWNDSDPDEELHLFSTRQEAVSFYKDKFDLN
jgi:hypothetical protein